MARNQFYHPARSSDTLLTLRILRGIAFTGTVVAGATTTALALDYPLNVKSESFARKNISAGDERLNADDGFTSLAPADRE